MPGRTRSRLARAAVLCVALLATIPVAGANAATQVTVDFESISGPPFFCNVPPPPALGVPLTIGIATFSGGAVLTAASFLPADPTSVYGTAQGPSIGVNCPTYGYVPKIEISFSRPVNGFGVELINGNTVTVSYTVTSPTGGTVTKSLVSNDNAGADTFTLPDTGVTSVSIEPTVPASIWDFFIDDVRFTPWPSAFADCRDGGWRDYGVFRNQGDCVSYVATGGTNGPALAGAQG